MPQRRPRPHPELPGTLSLARSNLRSARAIALPLLPDMPDFDRGYRESKGLVIHHGRLSRHEMPVVEEEDLPRIRPLLRSLGIPHHVHEMEARHLVPIQRDIWLDKCVAAIRAHGGVLPTIVQLQSTHLVVAQDHTIADGHHRWLTAMLILSSMPVLVLEVHVPHVELLNALGALDTLTGRARNM